MTKGNGVCTNQGQRTLPACAILTISSGEQTLFVRTSERATENMQASSQQSRGTRNIYGPAGLVLLALWAAFNWGATLVDICRFYVVIPTWDYWRVAEHVTQVKNLDFRFLWTQHNEHRIVFPDIVFSLDILLFHGRRLLPILVSVFCYVGCWAILANTILLDGALSRATRVATVLLTGILLGWKASALVLAEPFLLQWTLCELASLLSLFALTRVARSQSPGPMALVVLAAVVATYSSANGLLIWPVLLAACYLLRLSKSQKAVVAVSATAADGLYFIGYRFSGTTNLAGMAAHPMQALAFIAAYLSMPFGGMKSPRFGIYVGLLNLAVMAVLFAISIRRRTLATLQGTVLFGSYAFALMTAALTASGRMEAKDPLLADARAYRYLIPLTVNWAVFVATTIWTVAHSGRRKAAMPVILVLFCALLAISFWKLRWYLVIGSRPYTDAQITQLGIENGITDFRLIHQVSPEPSLVERDLALLRRARLSIFSGSQPRFLGEPLKKVAGGIRSLKAGAVTRIFPVVSGLEITGWAAGGASGFEQVLFTDESDTVIGLGRRWGLPAELATAGVHAGTAWLGFISAKFPAKRFSAYVLDPGGQELWRLPKTYEAPVITQVAAADVGPEIKSVAWQMDPSWTRGGTGPDNLYGPTPSGLVYGTGRAAAGRMGQIASSGIPSPKGNCLIIPVLHGWSTAGLSVELLDSETGRSLGQVPMLDGDIHWSFWRMPIAVGTKSVRFVASDADQTRDQWLAIASPAECR